MRAIATTYPRHPEKPTDTVIKVLAKRSFLKQYLHFVESTDWDEELLYQEKWINRICYAVIITSALLFAPFLILSLLK